MPKIHINKGQIKRFGVHSVSCASLDSPLVDQLMAGVKANVIFSDPPWGDGNLKYWATMNKKMSGSSPEPLTYDHLKSALFGLVDKYVDGHIMIETGLRWVDQFEEDFKDRGYHHVRRIPVEYPASGKMYPSVIVYGTTDPEVNWPDEPEDGRRHAQPRVDDMLGATTLPGDIVFDPCCGMGFTAQSCIRHGLKFYGNEFNEVRLSKTIDRFHRSVKRKVG